MLTAVLEKPGSFVVREAPIPEIAPDEVLVRVAACGVCSSDLHLWSGKASADGYPRHLGHEVSGVVEMVGAEVSGLAPGDRVGCWVLAKGYSDFVAVKANHCAPAGDLTLDLVLAEPIACAVNAVELAEVALGDDVVIIGAGFMGNLVQALVNLRGPRQVIVADSRPDALERAQRIGATRVVNVADESLPDLVREMTDGRGADVTFEVTGTQAALTASGEVTRMSGTIAIVGYHQGPSREIPLGYWNWMAFTIANAHFRDEATILHGMEAGMRLLTSGRLSLEVLVTHRFPLDRIGEAFAASVEKPAGFGKATVVLDQSLIAPGP
jgi:threonine dehydrogenase-like Zn-dependent dehydrogenase